MSFPSNSSRTISVYGGAGARGTRISSSPPGFLNSSPRSMQDLNSRLASYLEKVHSLENANADLERNIGEWYDSHTVVTFDHSVFEDTIKDLKNEIQSISQDNASIILSVDNAKLTANDFKLKYENELAMRRVIDADIANLRKILDKSSLSRSDLEMEIEALKEELIKLQSNHEEEISLAGVEVKGQVNVCMDAAPSMDLNQAISEIRLHNETMTEKKAQELKSWSESKITKLQQEVVTHKEELQNSRTELRELARSLKMRQIELQTHQSMKLALVGELEDTQDRYGDQLAILQATVTGLEDQLSQFHDKIGSNKQDYESLLDVKTRLELEIAEYRRMLDGDERC
ncbi:keratin 98 [Siphateles boraxobius]|uniref:keratin 98 n=1 Tax=Siphateles boraxobius TaxID=180520 RepID=UPI00406288A0